MNNQASKGIKQCVAMLDGVEGARTPLLSVHRQRAAKLVYNALRTPRTAEEQRGFSRALAEYLAIVAEGSVPDEGAQVRKELERRSRNRGGRVR